MPQRYDVLIGGPGTGKTHIAPRLASRRSGIRSGSYQSANGPQAVIPGEVIPYDWNCAVARTRYAGLPLEVM
jgi:hypothetical protein